YRGGLVHRGRPHVDQHLVGRGHGRRHVLEREIIDGTPRATDHRPHVVLLTAQEYTSAPPTHAPLSRQGRRRAGRRAVPEARRQGLVSAAPFDSSRTPTPENPPMRRLSRPLALLLAVLLLAPTTVVPTAALAAEDVKIALVAPLSGRWARQGQLKKMGAEMAIEEINSQGGIKALGGAKLVLREADAGDSVEKAVSAAQRVLTREKISAGIGSWLSSFTLGVTEVAERLEVPWFTLSYADSITERNFKYTFQTSPI